MIIPMLPTDAELLVVAIAVAYSLASVALQRKLTNPKRNREIQYNMQKISKELNELIKRNAAQEEIKAKQAELMPLMSTSMKSQFTPMFVILPIFLVLYYWFIPHLLVFMPQVFASVTKAEVLELFFIVVFVLGFASSFAVLAYDKKKAREEREARERSESSGPVQNAAV
jgi:uncharacterized membrane protein (DUF106 family)